MHKLTLVLLAFIASSASLFAQSDRIILAIEDGNLKRALKLAETSAEDDEFKKDPEVYFLTAEVYYKIMDDQFLSSKYPDALKDGIKALEKGRRLNNGEFYPEYDDLVNNYVAKNNEEAARQYKINKFTKAVKFYETSYELNGDMTAVYWMGKNWLMQTDTAQAEVYYKQVIAWSNDQKLEGKAVPQVISDAYIHFADKYWLSQKYDSANVFLESARKVFGGNAKIDYFQKEVTKQQIDMLPPSSLMMEKIKYILGFFPTDTLFLQKENALYLYLLRNHYSNNDTSSLDTMLKVFTDEKVERSASKLVNQYKKGDQFIEDKPENVLWKLVKYYSKFDHPEISNYVAHKYIQQSAKDASVESLKARYAVIIDYAAKSYTLKLANQLLLSSEKIFGESASTKSIRSSLISKNENSDLSTSDQGALFELYTKQYNLSKLPENVQLKIESYVEALVREKKYREAKRVLNIVEPADPENPIWIRKQDYLAKQDFYHSYYMTKVKEETVAGMKVGGFTWDGSTAMCEPGTIDPKIQQKVEDRINYFRRQAGVPDIFLDPELNDWCQKAALMMEANKNLSHEPDSRWSCYTDEGAHAARYSLLSKGANTVIAVTSFMADNQNPSAGNRRWLLYPNGLALGHGSTENACAIWASDDSGSIDTNLYKEQFVAWPPEGNIPKMMVFKYWSFSIDQDLNGAKVTMKMGDNNIPLKMNYFDGGNRLPSLVFEPQLDLTTLTDKTKVDVSVVLKNGRRYDYSVLIFDFDPVGY